MLPNACLKMNGDSGLTAVLRGNMWCVTHGFYVGLMLLIINSDWYRHMYGTCVRPLTSFSRFISVCFLLLR